MTLITLAMIIVVFTVTVLSSISDVRSLCIPNIYALVVIGCFIPAWLATPAAFAPLWHHIAAMVAMFTVTYFMFYKGMMGGGDSKLATALALWIGLKGL